MVRDSEHAANSYVMVSLSFQDVFASAVSPDLVHSLLHCTEKSEKK